MEQPARTPRSTSTALVTLLLLLTGAYTSPVHAAPAAAAATEKISLTPVRRIWDQSRVTDREKTRMELTDLIFYKGNWYCGFREGLIHGSHPSGRARIIRSPDGEKWESVALFAWDAADVREPKFSVTAEGTLVVNTSLYFVSKKERSNGGYYQLDRRVGLPHDESESGVVRQSVTWLSSDGRNWSSAYACPSGVNTWRWEVSWFNGMGYSIGHPGLGGKDLRGTLYRTRDGQSWRVLRQEIYPDVEGNEAALTFDANNQAICLLRAGKTSVEIGTGKPPYYQEWEWTTARVDWNGDGVLRPAKEVIIGSLGGPKIFQLRDGRMVGLGRARGPGRAGGSVNLFWVDPKQAIMTRFAELDGTSYAGAVEHEGAIWVSCADSDAAGIYLGKVKL